MNILIHSFGFIALHSVLIFTGGVFYTRMQQSRKKGLVNINVLNKRLSESEWLKQL